jgi:hypothetical protein
MPPAYRDFSAVAKAEVINGSRPVTIGGPSKFSQVHALPGELASGIVGGFDFALFRQLFSSPIEQHQNAGDDCERRNCLKPELNLYEERWSRIQICEKFLPIQDPISNEAQKIQQNYNGAADPQHDHQVQDRGLKRAGNP